MTVQIEGRVISAYIQCSIFHVDKRAMSGKPWGVHRSVFQADTMTASISDHVISAKNDTLTNYFPPHFKLTAMHLPAAD